MEFRDLKFVMRKPKKIDSYQPKEHGVHINGFFIRNGKINPETFYLEDEKDKEFELELL